MILAQHRVNTIEALKAVDPSQGVEVDLRADNSRIVLNHDPYKGGCDFQEYLEYYRNSLLILNIKEAGIEDDVIKMVKDASIKNFFLLDVEFPYLYQASRRGIRDIAVRYSEDESIENATKYIGKVDWVWIDTNTQLPLNTSVVDQLAPFKTCLVCPERWGRPEDIESYQRQMRKLNFTPDAVMCNKLLLQQWSLGFGLEIQRENT